MLLVCITRAGLGGRRGQTLGGVFVGHGRVRVSGRRVIASDQDLIRSSRLRESAGAETARDVTPAWFCPMSNSQLILSVILRITVSGWWRSDL